MSAEFPGDTETGVLDAEVFEPGSKAEERFAEFANDEPCPVLDPATGLCELYDARPMTCRTFGPPVRSEGGLGVCELCFHGATDEQIAACEMVADPDDLEWKLLAKVEKARGRAWADDCCVRCEVTRSVVFRALQALFINGILIFPPIPTILSPQLENASFVLR